MFLKNWVMLVALTAPILWLAHGVTVKNPKIEIWVGFKGTSEKDRDVVFLRRALKEKKVQGIILFGRNIENPEQLKNLISFLTDSNPSIPVSIDQEGGRLMRLNQNKGFHHAGKMLAAAAYFNPGPTKELAVPTITKPTEEQALKHIGDVHGSAAQEMANLGINVIFGPVSDVNINPECPVIGKLDRSFSNDSGQVTRCCNAVLSSYEKYGLRGCLKHAPGHGSANVDSHKGVTDVTKTWTISELQPFVECFKAHSGTAIMVGHLINKEIDPDFPASMSKKTVALMNSAMRAAGIDKKPLYIADGYEMKAVFNRYKPQEFLNYCANAGVGVVLFFCDDKYYPPHCTLQDFLKEHLGLEASHKDTVVTVPS
jgi:beta-N-acetylhexosaminidase